MPSPSPTKLAKISNAKFAIDRNVVGFASAIVIIYPVANFTVADLYIADIAFAGIIIDNPTSTAMVSPFLLFSTRPFICLYCIAGSHDIKKT
jgi:hypothetical protein